MEGNRLYGRGSNDMKAGVATNLFVAEALDDLGLRLSGDLIFETVVDEEFGGVNGTLAGRVAGYQRRCGGGFRAFVPARLRGAARRPHGTHHVLRGGRRVDRRRFSRRRGGPACALPGGGEGVRGVAAGGGAGASDVRELPGPGAGVDPEDLHIAVGYGRTDDHARDVPR